MLTQPLVETKLDGLPLVRRGKVRDVYQVGDRLLLIATDRISAFDYVLGSGIPDKGRVLTQLSAFWFERTRDIVPNHLIAVDVARFPAALQTHRNELVGRSMLARRTTPIPVECVARGYLSGSGWKDYKATGEVCGIRLPDGLRESDQLPEPIFTPATKAESGHDENISEEAAAAAIGADLLARLKRLTMDIYAHGHAYAESRGIILADTKFEFGLTDDGELLLIDELMTPGLVTLLATRSVLTGRSAAELRQTVRPRLPGVDSLEQTAAGSFPAGSGREPDSRQVPGRLPPPDRSRAGHRACVSCSIGWSG